MQSIDYRRFRSGGSKSLRSDDKMISNFEEESIVGRSGFQRTSDRINSRVAIISCRGRQPTTSRVGCFLISKIPLTWRHYRGVSMPLACQWEPQLDVQRIQRRSQS